MNHPAGEGTPPSPGGGVCLVLGAGGLRGLAHVGVLKALRRACVPIDSIIGVSIGSLVAAFYAGLGLEPDEIGAGLLRVNTSTFFSMGVALRRWGFLSVRARRAVSGHLELLGRLENLRLDRLHFGVRRLGLLAMDLPGGQEVFAATGLRCPVPPGRLVMGGISIPGFFPPVRAESTGRTYRLADGGFSRSIPVERAFQPPFCARRVLVVDLRVIRGFRERRRGRWPRLESEHGESLIRLLPDVKRTGTIFCRRGQGARLVRAGEEAVTGEVVSRLTLSRGGC